MMYWYIGDAKISKIIIKKKGNPEGLPFPFM